MTYSTSQLCNNCIIGAVRIYLLSNYLLSTPDNRGRIRKNFS